LKGELGQVYSTHGNAYAVERTHSEDMQAEGRIILKLILRIFYRSVRPEYN
jgi:hypothetical protein